jgi:Flp pilus assembly protein TadG
LPGSKKGGDKLMNRPIVERKSDACTGSALVETALLLPLLLLLLLNAVNFGMYIYGWISVANAARVAAEYATYNGAAVSAPRQPSTSQIQSVVTNDVTTLPNNASISTTVCYQVASGTPTCAIPGLIAAPDASSSSLTAVTVSYTYQPFLSATFVGIPLTPPTTTFTQQFVMRNMQ